MNTKSVLLVERYETLASLVAKILETEGYNVTSVNTLTEALKNLQSSKFDLVITASFKQTELYTLDPTFLNELKSVAQDTPIVLCSSYACSSDIRRAELGLADILPKPFDVDELLQKVNKVLALNDGNLSTTKAA